MKEISVNCKIYINEYNFIQSRCNDIRSGSALHYIGRLKKGSAKIVSDDVILKLREGDVFYIPKGLKYMSYWYVNDMSVTFDSFGFSEFPCVEHKHFALQRIDATERAISLVDIISEEGRLYRNSLKISGWFFSLLSEILPDLTESGKQDRSGALVSKALSVMRGDPSLDIPAVAAACAVSQSGLYSAFRQNGYKTPNEERQKILIEKAKNLLISTDEPIENISSVLGFSSSSYFRKIFAKYTGKSPRQVRKDAFI